jgi:hypothetical protein
LFDDTLPYIKYRKISTQEIEKIINSLNTKNSYGYDEISTRLLKISAPYISSPLNFICNKVLGTGFFPSCLKYSEIKALHKKGDENNIANYRPISRLPSFSKVFEMLYIYIRSLEHINNKNILVKEQFSFRCKSSTEIASYNLISAILNALNKKSLIGVVFCDLVKVFDCINHKILLSKLKFYGITGTFYSLSNSYLHDGYQRVILENNQHKLCSSWGIIRHGAPQGSMLGPLLFLLYINGITKITHAKDDNNKSKLVPFVDDTSLPITSSKPKLFLFVDDTSLLITSSNPTNFVQDINAKL